MTTAHGPGGNKRKQMTSHANDVINVANVAYSRPAAVLHLHAFVYKQWLLKPLKSVTLKDHNPWISALLVVMFNVRLTKKFRNPVQSLRDMEQYLSRQFSIVSYLLRLV